jgi:hypothetical protein
MKIHLLRFLLIVSASMPLNIPAALSQGTNILTLPAYTLISTVPWRDSIYRFPIFQKGRIIYSHEFEPDYDFTLNYNMYYEKMDYISVSGDTLSITNTREIKLVKIGDKEFFHDYQTGYYELILPLPVALAAKNVFFLYNIEYSSYKRPSLTPVRPALPTSDIRGVSEPFDRLYQKGSLYFLIDQNHQVHKPARSALLKLFPDHQQQILEYLAENPTDFGSRQDLIKLISYCNQFNKNVKKQEISKATLTLPAGETVASVRKGEATYRFPEFQEAKITWADHSVSHLSRVNYNFVTDKIDVMLDNGDIVQLKRGAEAKIVNLDGTVFIQDFDKGLLEMRLQGPLGLAVRNRYVLVTDKAALKARGFDAQAEAYDISNNASKADFNRLYHLEQRFYFMDRQKRLYDADKLSLYKLMRPIKDKLMVFLNENDISFDRETDLLRIISFCNQNAKN